MQSPIILLGIAVASLLIVWQKGRNKGLEAILLLVVLGGSHLYHFLVIQTLAFIHSFLSSKIPLSSSFPDERAMFTMILYGTRLFLLIRHTSVRYFQLAAPFLCIFLLIVLAALNIVFNSFLPSDIAGGYVYGIVWMFFNFLLFELIRIAVY
ncbi:hypothetical protein [Metabacillus sp. RGM 3146]|uniref:hypothetical protein n=1 Tax=Metabacillus sp. RGM 3146 TaxID=3401092 RepID=UPI003B99EC0A